MTLGGSGRKDLACCCHRGCPFFPGTPSWEPFERRILIFSVVAPLSLFPIETILAYFDLSLSLPVVTPGLT